MSKFFYVTTVSFTLEPNGHGSLTLQVFAFWTTTSFLPVLSA